MLTSNYNNKISRVVGNIGLYEEHWNFLEEQNEIQNVNIKPKRS